MKRTLALCAILGLASAGPALAGEIRERTTFFMVKAKSFEDVNEQLEKAGPLLAQAVRHPASTIASFAQNFTYKDVAGGCAIDRGQVTLDLKTSLPRWSAPADSPRDIRVKWKIQSDEIAAHEAEHARIAKSWLKRVNAEIRALPAEKTCAAMTAKVLATFGTLMRSHKAEQRAFDAAEGREFDARLARKLAESENHLANR